MNEWRETTQTMVGDSPNRAGYAEWIALGAVVAGSIGAIVGAAKCNHRGAHAHPYAARPDSASLTAPHGDKLSSAL